MINYGKSNYDYDDETVVSFAPRTDSRFTRIEGVPPQIHRFAVPPGFHTWYVIRGKKITRNTRFFFTRQTRALHLSVEERLIVNQLPVYRTFGITTRHR